MARKKGSKLIDKLHKFAVENRLSDNVGGVYSPYINCSAFSRVVEQMSLESVEEGILYLKKNKDGSYIARLYTPDKKMSRESN
jgi:hypothetical protein